MKETLFATFLLSSFSDACITHYVIQYDQVMEANPIMIFAMQEIPGGMFSVKAGVCLAIMLCWKRCTESFMVGIALGMTAITFWNSCLLVYVL